MVRTCRMPMTESLNASSSRLSALRARVLRILRITTIAMKATSSPPTIPPISAATLAGSGAVSDGTSLVPPEKMYEDWAFIDGFCCSKGDLGDGSHVPTVSYDTADELSGTAS